MTRDSNRVPESTFAALRAHFDEGEIVEIAAVVGLFAYFNRFNNAFGARAHQARGGRGHVGPARESRPL